MKNLVNKIRSFLNKLIHNEYFIAFCFLYLTGVICFGICAFKNDCTIPMGGDYVLQTYAFYSQGYHVFWDFIRTGQYPLFDFSNFLGANYIGTQSFYYVFSPLFYLLCLWPESLLYQGIFFHMVFKFALGSFFMYILLRKYFHTSKLMSFAGGFVYGFSGWTLFYLWFHFGDVVAFFPLLIMGFERCLKERKGGLLAISMFLCGMSNYFFLVNFIIFGLFYALYRWIYIYGINNKKGYSAKVRWGVLLQGILYCLVGVMLSGICLLPSLHVATSTNRTQSSTAYLTSLLSIIFQNPSKVSGAWVLSELKSVKDIFNWDNFKQLLHVLFVWNERTVSSSTVVSPKSHIGYIISNWLFMNTNCWDNILYDNVSLDNALGGFFITTPLTMLLVPSMVKTFKSKRPWEIFGLIMCLFLPFIPITSHVAFGFTSLYGRWQIWIVLIGIIYIIPTLDKYENVNRRWITVNLAVNYGLAAIAYNISKEAGSLPTATGKVFGHSVNYMLAIVIAELIVMFLVWFIYRFKFFRPVIVKRIILIVMVGEIGASVVVTCEQKGYYNWNQYYLSQPQYTELTKVVADLKKDDEGFYRILNTEANRSTMNLPSALNYAGSSMFNSTYSFDLNAFISRARLAYGGSWTMGNNLKRYWLDQYIGTKYYIIDKQDRNNDNKDYYQDLTIAYDGKYQSVNEEAQDYNLNLGWNYKLYKEYKYYDVYINTQNVGIGYVVDNYVSVKNIDPSYATNAYSHEALYYEELYSDTAIILEDDLAFVDNSVNEANKVEKRYKKYQTESANKFDLFFSPREDYSYHLTQNYERQTYPLTGTSFKKEEIAAILPSNSQFLHRRWEKYGRFGDQLIMKVKEGQTKVCPLASKDNQCYVNVGFKNGPKVLISLYNGDTLITQDGHAVSGNSTYNYNVERQSFRGFYVDQPVDRIVIEYVSDTAYDKTFTNGSLTVSINYDYQSNLQATQDVINSNLLQDVTYANNTFKFKTNTVGKKVAVTNIPIDDGWTLKANGQKIKTFNVNGGFVGFITLDGETEYELSYFTPLLKEGFALSGLGLLLFIALWFIYRNTRVDILECENQVAYAYYKKQKEEEDKFDEKVKEQKNKFIKWIKSLFTKKKKEDKGDGVQK